MAMPYCLSSVSISAALLLAASCSGPASNHGTAGDPPLTVSPSGDPEDGPDAGHAGDNAVSPGAAEAGLDDAPYEGPDGGIATIGGMLAGISFNAALAYSTMRRPFTCRGFEEEYESQITITASDESLCDPSNAAPDPCAQVAGRRLISFGVTAVRQSKTPLGPGAYAIGTAVAELPFASASVLLRDGACNLAIHSATSGTVMFTAVSDAFIAGSVDIVFADGGTLSGSFSAPHCVSAQKAMGVECDPLPTCATTPTCNVP